MGLFRLGDFTLSSGQKSRWKIDCDYLTEEVWKTLAFMSQNWRFVYKEVIPVPKGKSRSTIDNAVRFADALKSYCDPAANSYLIVDDVYTTGKSMEDCRRALREKVGPEPIIFGLVVFARAGSIERENLV